MPSCEGGQERGDIIGGASKTHERRPRTHINPTRDRVATKALRFTGRLLRWLRCEGLVTERARTLKCSRTIATHHLALGLDG